MNFYVRFHYLPNGKATGSTVFDSLEKALKQYKYYLPSKIMKENPIFCSIERSFENLEDGDNKALYIPLFFEH